MKLYNLQTGKTIVITGFNLSDSRLEIELLTNFFEEKGVFSTENIQLTDDNKAQIISYLVDKMPFFENYSPIAPWAQNTSEFPIRLYLTNDQLSFLSTNYIEMILKVKDNPRAISGNGLFIYLRTLTEDDKNALLQLKAHIEYA